MKTLLSLLILFAAPLASAQGETARMPETDAVEEYDQPAADPRQAFADKLPGLSDESYRNLARAAVDRETGMLDQTQLDREIQVVQWLVLKKAQAVVQDAERALVQESEQKSLEAA